MMSNSQKNILILRFESRVSILDHISQITYLELHSKQCDFEAEIRNRISCEIFEEVKSLLNIAI